MGTACSSEREDHGSQRARAKKSRRAKRAASPRDTDDDGANSLSQRSTSGRSTQLSGRRSRSGSDRSSARSPTTTRARQSPQLASSSPRTRTAASPAPGTSPAHSATAAAADDINPLDLPGPLHASSSGDSEAGDGVSVPVAIDGEVEDMSGRRLNSTGVFLADIHGEVTAPRSNSTPMRSFHSSANENSRRTSRVTDSDTQSPAASGPFTPSDGDGRVKASRRMRNDAVSPSADEPVSATDTGAASAGSLMRPGHMRRSMSASNVPTLSASGASGTASGLLSDGSRRPSLPSLAPCLSGSGSTHARPTPRANSLSPGLGLSSGRPTGKQRNSLVALPAGNASPSTAALADFMATVDSAHSDRRGRPELAADPWVQIALES